MTEAATGVVVEIEDRKFLLPFDRVSFVVPLRGMEGNTLTMPRGRLPLVDPRERLGLALAGRARNAVAIKGRFGFYALAVGGVELVGAESAGKETELTSLDLSSILSEEEERALFAESVP